MTVPATVDRRVHGIFVLFAGTMMRRGCYPVGWQVPAAVGKLPLQRVVGKASCITAAYADGSAFVAGCVDAAMGEMIVAAEIAGGGGADDAVADADAVLADARTGFRPSRACTRRGGSEVVVVADVLAEALADAVYHPCHSNRYRIHPYLAFRLYHHRTVAVHPYHTFQKHQCGVYI